MPSSKIQKGLGLGIQASALVAAFNIAAVGTAGMTTALAVGGAFLTGHIIEQNAD